ncbi:MAG: sulfatase [Candidatus Aegiribacteria sp.]
MKKPIVPLLMCLIMALSACGGNRDEMEPDLSVLLIIIDTLRADHVGYWGYERDITPVLDSLAASGTAWMQTQAQSSWTLPSVSSILTGLAPREHGAGASGGRMFGLSPSIPTLQGILHSRGMSTCAILNVIFLSEDFGFHRGFDHFDCRGVTGNRGTRRADETTDAAVSWLEGRDEAFLAVVHFYDPHIPYDPPSPYDTLYASSSMGPLRSGEFQMDTMTSVNSGAAVLSPEGLTGMMGLYDGEIAFTDAELGRLLRYLRTSGLSESTLVVVTADHGEEFLEHSGIEHGRTLYQEVLHVPLIMSGPGVPAGVRREEPSALLDLLPTILSFIDVEPPPGLPGADLLAPVSASRDLPASNLLWSNVPQASMRRDSLKMIWYSEDGGTELYDLASDPLEQEPLSVVHRSMIESVEYYWSTPPVADPPEVSFGEAQNNQLRDLGYIR